MQLSYTTSMTIGSNGRRVTGEGRAIARPFKEQVNVRTITVGGTDDGTYSFTVVDHTGTAQTVSYVASSKTAAEIAAALAAAGEAVEELNGVAAFTAAAAVLTITGLHAGISLTVTLVSNPGTNMVLAETQAAAKARMRLGIGLIDVGGTECRVPASGDAATAFAGVCEHSTEVKANDEVGPSGETYEGYDNGSMVSILRQGPIWVLPEEAITAVTDSVYMRCVASGSEVAGAFRKTIDGVAQVTTCAPTAANSTEFRIEINVPGVGTWEAYMTSDSDATKTEISTALQSMINAITECPITASLTGTGDNKDLVLTGDNQGQVFYVRDVGAGTIGFTATTAAAADCIDVSAYARWGSIGSANTPVRLDVHLP